MLRFTLYTHRNKYDSSGVFVLSPADLNRYGGVLSEVGWPQPVGVKTKAGCSFFSLLGMKRNGGGGRQLVFIYLADIAACPHSALRSH